LSTVCATAGHLVATEALRLLLQPDSPAEKSEEISLSLGTYRSWRTELPRKQECTCHAGRWDFRELIQSPSQVTLAMLAEHRAGTASDQPGFWQVRGEMPWITTSVCGACGQVSPTRCFARLGWEVGRCQCKGPLIAGQLGVRSVIPPDDLQACWDRPLSALGVMPGGAVGLALEDDWTWFVCDGEAGPTNGGDNDQAT
jgi:hypothetical protein